MLVAACAAALLGWALAMLVGLWAESRGYRLTEWAPFTLEPAKVDGVAASSLPTAGPMRLVGVAGRRAFFAMNGGTGAQTQRVTAVSEGDSLPSGEQLLRVERDGVVLLSAAGETKVELRPARPAAPTKSGGAKPCRLATSDRAVAIFLDPAVAKALSVERATFARMFEAVEAAGGLRAKGTGGTTAMFAIQDGDILLRADGAPLRSGEAVVTEIISRVEAGGSVVVEGTRAGAPRRWVYAAKGCAT